MSYVEAAPESEIELAGKVRERIFGGTTESFFAADHSELTKLTRFLHGAFGTISISQQNTFRFPL